MIWALEVRLKEASDYQAAAPLGMTRSAPPPIPRRCLQGDPGGHRLGRLKADQRLVGADLAKRHGSSTTPVREALQLLRGEGFVIFTRNRGARVRPIDRDFIGDIYEIGVLIEPS